MEDMAYYDLIAYFHEIYVHVQPRKRKINFDFIIYAQNATFAVDVFFSNSLSNMKNEARKKINTYSSFGQKVCIVQMNSQLNGNIQQLSARATQNIGLFDYDEFIKEIKSKFKPLVAPKGYHEFDLSDLVLQHRVKKATRP